MPPDPLENLAPTPPELLISMTSYLGLASPLGPVVQKPVNVNPGLVEILWPKL